VTVLSRAAAFVAAAALLAGCTTSESEPPPAAKPGVTPGGVLTVGITEPASVEPSNAFEPASQLVASTLCDTLVHLDPKTGELKPAIAQSWVISDGGKRFTIKLRKGIRFHGGRKLTSDDVVSSLSRLASQDNASFQAKLLTPVIGYAEVHGDKDTDNDERRRQLLGLRVIDGSSFEVRLASPQADFMRVLAHVATAPVPRQGETADADRFARQPECAGPYRLEGEWAPKAGQIVLKRFDGYYGKNTGYTGGGAGYADTVVFKVFPDRAAAVRAYQAGEVDVAVLGADEVPAAKAMGADLVVEPRGGVEYLGIPSSLKPFDVPALRRALSMGLDRQRLIERAMGGAGVPATGFIPPTVGDVYADGSCGPATPPTGDAAAAKALVESANRPLSGLRVKLYFNDEFGNGAIAKDVADQWREVFGLETELVAQAWDNYVVKGQSNEGFDGMFRESWRGDYAGADAYVYPLFHSSGIGRDNLARFSDGKFDRALDRGARETTDDTARRFDYRNSEKTLCESMPMIPLAFATGATLVRKARLDSAVDGFTERSNGLPALRELYVKQS
jgi:oligopeptide transport system substrate-binding protein